MGSNDHSNCGRETVEIAVVGIGCRFPQAVRSPADLWDVLINSRDQVRDIPLDRWDCASFYHPQRAAIGTSISMWGAFLDDIGHFDPVPFGLSPREAQHMDPQQRLALEASYEAIEDSGIPVDQLSGQTVGVFFGVSTLGLRDATV